MINEKPTKPIQNQGNKMIQMDQISLWMGDLYINLKVAQDEIRMLKEENLRLSTKLGKCKCEKET